MAAFFCASCLCRLPKEIRVLLIDQVRGDLKDLAIRADELYQHHKSATVAMLDTAVDAELAEVVAALAVKAGKGRFKGGKKTSNNSGGGSGGGANSGSGGGAASGGGKSYFICDRHWRYGGKAYRCDAPSKCQWQTGN